MDGNRFAIVLNVYISEGNGTGHYSLSIIQEDENIHIEIPERFGGNRKEIVFSYGSTDESRGRVEVLSPDPQNIPQKRYVFGYMNKEQCQYLIDLMDTLLGDPIKNPEPGIPAYYVEEYDFRYYSLDDKRYCGSFIARMLSYAEFDEMLCNAQGIIEWFQEELLYANHYRFLREFPKAQASALTILDFNLMPYEGRSWKK